LASKHSEAAGIDILAVGYLKRLLMKNIILLLVAAVVLCGFSVCNTISGVGQDVSGVGRDVSAGARSVERSIQNN
jgi:predicted small secreted protein